MHADKTANFKNKFVNYYVDESLAQLIKIRVLGLNIRYLRFHYDEQKLLLDILEEKSGILALIETWVAQIASIKNYNSGGYQTIESNPRLDCRQRSSGVAFYIKAEFF